MSESPLRTLYKALRDLQGSMPGLEIGVEQTASGLLAMRLSRYPKIMGIERTVFQENGYLYRLSSDRFQDELNALEPHLAALYALSVQIDVPQWTVLAGDWGGLIRGLEHGIDLMDGPGDLPDTEPGVFLETRQETHHVRAVLQKICQNLPNKMALVLAGHSTHHEALQAQNARCLLQEQAPDFWACLQQNSRRNRNVVIEIKRFDRLIGVFMRHNDQGSLLMKARA